MAAAIAVAEAFVGTIERARWHAEEQFFRLAAFERDPLVDVARTDRHRHGVKSRVEQLFLPERGTERLTVDGDHGTRVQRPGEQHREPRHSHVQLRQLSHGLASRLDMHRW